MSGHLVPAIRRCLTKRWRILPFGFVLLLASACESEAPRMLGEDDVLFVVEDALWAEIQDAMTSALKPQLPGLLPENTYRISHAPPAAVSGSDLSRFLQIVILGRPDDALASETLQALPDFPEQWPTLHQRADVWASGQRVTMVALPDEGEFEAALQHVDTIARLVDGHYREWTRLRMYATGVNSEISSQLASRGIRLEVPSAYRSFLSEDSAYHFMTLGNDQARLVRSVLVTWSPLDDSVPTAESVLTRRQEVVDRFYTEAQTTPADFVRSRPLDTGTGGLEVSGAWNGRMEGQPHAGPFVSRSIDCAEQGRRYFLDAWLFAPSRDKYMYLVQLEAVLDSFECAAGVS